MTQQLAFESFEHGADPHTTSRALARISDPLTSHAAAARVLEFAPAQHDLIVDVLKKHGALTVHEVAVYCRLSAHEVGKRMGELGKMGRAQVVHDEAGAEVTRRTPSGRAARVWWTA